MASVEHTGMYNITACLEKCIPCRTGVAWRHNVKLITRKLIGPKPISWHNTYRVRFQLLTEIMHL